LGYNQQVAVDVTRNLGIGAQYVVVSNSGEGEIDDCVTVARDWHRKVGHIHPFSSDEEWEAGIEDIEERTHIIPQPETLGGLEAVEELMKRPEIRILFFAMTDASRELVGSEYSRSKPDWYLDELWEMIDQAVELGEKHDCAVAANTSYAYDMEEMADRVVKLHEHGVRMIMLQSAPFLFQVAVGDLLENIQGRMS
jgi:hypothetical protein